MTPFVIDGVSGMKDAIMRHTTIPQSAIVGNLSSTTVFSFASTGWVSL